MFHFANIANFYLKRHILREKYVFLSKKSKESVH